MTLQSSTSSASFNSCRILPFLCPCKSFIQTKYHPPLPFSKRTRKKLITNFTRQNFRRKFTTFLACVIPNDTRNRNANIELSKGSKGFVLKRLSNEWETEELSQEHSISNFTGFQEDPIVGKLRTQLGVIHPIPSPPINRNIVGLFVFFFFVGVVFDKAWNSRKKDRSSEEGKRGGAWPQVPTSFSLFLEKDLQRKESVEWVNMVLGKLWKVYRGGIENWLIGLLQPVIDDLKKPDYVERVEIKQFSLGDEPLSVRNVERRTSRRVNDLQYQIGLRYTGGARMLLMLSLKFGIIPIVVPVGVRDFDIDGELWVKLRLIPTEPWVGAVSWAFVSLPKIKFELSPFRLFNLMAIPVLSMFLTKLLTVDLPRLFVRPKKIVLDFQKGKAVGPVSNGAGEMQEGNRDFVGELSVTLVDARKLSYVFFGKTDPYVILNLGDQIMRSKKNSQTTVIGPPGEPIWNQDFHMLVSNPRKQKLNIQVKDSLGFTGLTIGTGEVDLGSLQDTVPTDKIVVLQGGWGLFRKTSSGEILLRLTYKAYVEDEDDDKNEVEHVDIDASDDEMSDSDESNAIYERGRWGSSNEMDKESFMDVLAALIVSEEFQGIVASDTGNNKLSNDASGAGSAVSRSRTLNAESLPSDNNNSSEGSAGSILVWFAVITSILVLIAVTLDGSNLFNP
ncbi:CALCIUM-DEPENDENT LIPID-BINDING (CALB DOMAIN) FAMILY PROTEIN [Salix purpurea]|uniref:CALCIUM-DEPENDENT LIPID-BINDING (CALB DOMAIN) FAMILY PROTEIN n=1 Tax=Salix purpurea TaxID=77065 RepID=A0A9Q0Z1V6_SALPP|nr:CALCIUM-DEPENDENT LIPID-BINDING (CALB DOMAIN) FAMILY PROTEIN [Salix purpurea]KAJ6718257.1 CALCIUM-DEPENDENT LIPID-BINDING (CALB DOMAIN) FAMILY PROTEIN [Salix purpurea]KAJ6718258.1 CALCIUM-DEPENDENT LIPID-BINDING (CALB DOMAIN) FAMILY PROTEIN [Salix purpurea]